MLYILCPFSVGRYYFCKISKLSFGVRPTAIHSNIFFFAFWIKFGKTKQIVVALVATTLKAQLSVAKTNIRLSGHKLYAGTIDYPFLNILVHISPYQHIKKVRNRSHAPKNVAPCCDINFFILPYNTEKHTKREHTFLPKGKRYTYPMLTMVVLCYSVCVARILYHTLDKL